MDLLGRYYITLISQVRLLGWMDYHWPSGNEAGASSALRICSAGNLGHTLGLSMEPAHWLKGRSHYGNDILRERPATLRDGQALMAVV